LSPLTLFCGQIFVFVFFITIHIELHRFVVIIIYYLLLTIVVLVAPIFYGCPGDFIVEIALRIGVDGLLPLRSKSLEELEPLANKVGFPACFLFFFLEVFVGSYC